MGQTPSQKRFRINPIEMGIFAIVGALFLNSVYNLFYESPAFQTEASRGLWSKTTERAPASSKRGETASSSLMGQITVPCQAPGQTQAIQIPNTNAMRVRLLVQLCESDVVKQAEVKNLTLTRPFEATVFADKSQDSFSTDYIPLEVGRNEISVHVTLASGKVTDRKLEVTRAAKL